MQVGEGLELGRYRLTERLGSGGMGHVWAARDTALERDVAVKVISEPFGIDPSNRERFRREALVLARLAHPNVVTVFDVGELDRPGSEPLPYLVMERLDGHALATELESGPLPQRRAATLMLQTARALAAAHLAGVIHRDLKPSNIHVSDAGHVTVLDFGLARVLDGDTTAALASLTTTGMVVGSCYYMSPEQAVGEHVTTASDVFSFGVILYEALSGRRPFEGSTPVHTLRVVAEGRYAPLADVTSDIHPALVAIAERCLAHDPRQRYSDGTALADDIEQAITQLPAASGVTTRTVLRQPVQALRRQRRRRRLRQLAGAALLTAAAAAIGLLAGRHGFEPRRHHPGAWQVTSLLERPGWVQAPSFHPAGTAVAVEHNDGPTAEILIVRADGSETVTVASASGGTILARPEFSPDGRRIAVSVIRADEHSVMVIPSTGGAPLAEVKPADHGAWIDDGHLVVARQTDEGSELWTHEIATGAEHALLAGAGGSWWGAVPRPGGGFAVLGGPSDISARVFLLSRPGATPVPLTGAPAAVGSLSWTPRGDALVGIVDHTLTALRPDASEPLLPALLALDGADLAPTGDRLAVVRNDRRNDLVAFDPATAEWSCVLCGENGLGWGSVGPGSTVAYRRKLGPDRSLFVRRPDGSDERVVPADDDASCPSFSPDGSRIAYLSTLPDGSTQLRVAALAGGDPVVIAEHVERSEFATWSPDGRFLAFAAGNPVSVWRSSSAGGQATPLTPDGGDYPRWSPDGRWIAYVVWTDATDPDQGAWVVPASGGTPRKIGDSPTQLGWSPDGSALWQVRRGQGGLELWAADTSSWEWRHVAPIRLGAPPAPHSEHIPFTVAPDRGTLVFNRRAVSGELLLISDIDASSW